jgi:expansin (peptidoglycan-binding protein)
LEPRRDFDPRPDAAMRTDFEPRGDGPSPRRDLEPRRESSARPDSAQLLDFEPRRDVPAPRRGLEPRGEFGSRPDGAARADFDARGSATERGSADAPLAGFEPRRDGPAPRRDLEPQRDGEPGWSAEPRRRTGELVPASADDWWNAPRGGRARDVETVVGGATPDVEAAEPALAGGGGRRRWLGPSLIAGSVLCSLALITGVATQFASSACAAPPPAGVVSNGQATFYDGGPGNCSYPNEPDDGLFVALGPSEYSASAACGSFLDVTGPNGSVRVKVVDQCPECQVGHLDLSRDAFARIGDPDAGVIDITYRAVANPAVPGPLTVLVKDGSNPDYLALQVDNHGNPLTKVQVGSTSLTRTSDNFWEASGGLGDGPFTVKVTDSQGRTATIPNIALEPGEIQRSSVSMSGGGAAAPVRTKAPTKPAPVATTAGSSPESGDDGSAVGETPDTPGSTDSTALADAAAPVANGTLPATPDPSSSSFLREQSEAPAVSTGRNSCG